MNRTLKLWAVLIALLVNALGFAQQTGPTQQTDPDPGVPTYCNWNSLPSGGSSCSTESCGSGCNITGYGPNHTECYGGGYPSPGCCQCTWSNTYCQCLFGIGSGTGRSVSTSYLEKHICAAEGDTAPYTYHCRPAQDGDPTGPEDPTTPVPVPY